MTEPSPTTETTSFQRFPRMMPFLTLLLAIGTLGLYVPYWLYTRTRLLNEMCPQQPIPSLIVALCMGALVMFVVMAFQVVSELPPQITLEQLREHPGFIRLMDAAMIVNILQLLWGLLFCHRLNLCAQAHAGNTLYSSYFWLSLSHFFIVNIFYLQFTLNRLIDSGTPNQSGLGIM